MVIGLAFAAMLVARMHPLHTTMTELTVDEARHSVRAVVRAFADDVTAAAKRRLSRGDYVAAGLAITDAAGRQLALRSCGVRHTGDVVFVCFDGTFDGSPRALRLADSLLCDLFDDQVNVVQIIDGGERRSMLFVRGDRAKPLR
ncbi:MAG TPA: DUF6702 family protein [Gemmatimonadaceae bacterium]|nr:DUF6702 family protein [Gemmatimonadaceae bacterium]